MQECGKRKRKNCGDDKLLKFYPCWGCLQCEQVHMGGDISQIKSQTDCDSCTEQYLRAIAMKSIVVSYLPQSRIWVTKKRHENPAF